ncbi:hypothetical protein HB837_09720 [Listeria innocua]|uniref:hypothetical protein n=1 Tax=Listeria innocua TaxID=1642 RepID=UPI00162A6839|nr:hypothetical protein [Listeria innocua]MBC1339609.1 hypothetical protein [Listeria innocua]MBC1352726.1 hypothetical protein [Listeria innocua]
MSKTGYIILFLVILSVFLFGIILKNNAVTTAIQQEKVKEQVYAQVQVERELEGKSKKNNTFDIVKKDMTSYLEIMYDTDETSLLKKYKESKRYLTGKAVEQLKPEGEKGVPVTEEKARGEVFRYAQHIKQSQVFYSPDEAGIKAKVVVFFTIRSSINGQTTDANYVLKATMNFNQKQNIWQISDVIDNQLVSDLMNQAYFN